MMCGVFHPIKIPMYHISILFYFFPKDEKLAFFLVLERDLGVDHEEVMKVTKSLTNAQVSVHDGKKFNSIICK